MKPTSDCELCNVAVAGQPDLVKVCMVIAKEGMTDKTPEGAIFYPFHFAEAPANKLIAGTFDKASQTSAYKRTAARVEPIEA